MEIVDFKVWEDSCEFLNTLDYSGITLFTKEELKKELNKNNSRIKIEEEEGSEKTIILECGRDFVDVEVDYKNQIELGGRVYRQVDKGGLPTRHLVYNNFENLTLGIELVKTTIDIGDRVKELYTTNKLLYVADSYSGDIKLNNR